MNKAILVGNLTRDVELSETPNGVAVCKFNIAVHREYGDKEVDFFNIVAWRGLAENCAKYLKKGNKAAIFGRLQNRSYEDKDGIKRYITEIVAEEVEFLTPKKDGEETVVASVRRERPQLEEMDDNQLPF